MTEHSFASQGRQMREEQAAKGPRAALGAKRATKAWSAGLQGLPVDCKAARSGVTEPPVDAPPLSGVSSPTSKNCQSACPSVHPRCHAGADGPSVLENFRLAHPLQKSDAPLRRRLQGCPRSVDPRHREVTRKPGGAKEGADLVQ